MLPPVNYLPSVAHAQQISAASNSAHQTLITLAQSDSKVTNANPPSSPTDNGCQASTVYGLKCTKSQHSKKTIYGFTNSGPAPGSSNSVTTPSRRNMYRVRYSVRSEKSMYTSSAEIKKTRSTVTGTC